MKTRIVCMLLASALSAAAGAETVVVVSAKSAVATLSKEQVADLFVGKTQQLGGASAALVDQAELKEAFTLRPPAATPRRSRPPGPSCCSPARATRPRKSAATPR